MQWEFVKGDTKELDTDKGKVKLTRIRALEHRDFDGVNNEVNVGDLGGYIQSEYNLSRNNIRGLEVLHDSSRCYWNVSPKNKAWVADGAYVFDRARVDGNAFLGNNAYLFDDAKLCDNVMVVGRGDGAVYVGGKTIIRNNITIVGAVSLTGNTTLYGDGMIWCKAGKFELSDLHSLLLHGDVRITTYGGCSGDICDGMFFCPEFGRTVVNGHGLMITGGTMNSLIVKIPAG